VTRADPQDVHRVLTANVLSSGDLSANSVQVLERNNLVALYEDDPEAGLAALHGGLAQNMNPFRLLGLAELSFLYAQNSGKREHYLVPYRRLTTRDAGNGSRVMLGVGAEVGCAVVLRAR
jgi:hypothetical protein